MAVNNNFFHVVSHADEVIRETDAAIKRGLTKCAVAAVGYARDLCPVDTGTLRRSISHKVVDKEAYIGTNVEYAPFVEFGTGAQNVPGGTTKPYWIYTGEDGKTHVGKPQKPKPFLKPAVSEHTDEYRRIIEAELKG